MSENGDNIPLVFTPDNEPYLGRAPLHQFDIAIVGALRANRAVADASRASELTDLQSAACEIIPQGISIGLSIRELMRQGYLFSAFVLLRPLIERAAIISYLAQNRESVELWKTGWKHGDRPSLRRMLDGMGWSQVDTSMAKQICEFFSHAVHGDPFASYWNTIPLKEGEIGYASGRILNRPDFCDVIAKSTFPHFLILMAMMAACFPSVEEVPSALCQTVERLFPKK
jgi:hypothetical protein